MRASSPPRRAEVRFFAVADLNDYDNAGSFQVTLTAVPEPSPGKSMLAELVGLLVALRRRSHA